MKKGIQWHIGCSGFHYKEWKTVFYPEKLPQRRWFEYYSGQFDTLELNVTFYRFPRLSFLQGWYEKSPAHFLFSVKAPRLITHYKKFADCGRLMSDFYNTIREGLREKLGPVLFQLPRQIEYSPETLRQIIHDMDISFDNVIEFRHSSWWKRSVYSTLASHGISFCGISHPTLPAEAIVNTPVVYYRFHGVPKLYYSAYDSQQLRQVVDAIKKTRTAKKVFIYFNNTASTAAITNARYVEEYIATVFSVPA